MNERAMARHNIPRKKILAQFTEGQAKTLWLLLDATMCGHDDVREKARWKRMRDKFAMPPKELRGE